jgi:hypothetical protein
MMMSAPPSSTSVYWRAMAMMRPSCICFGCTNSTAVLLVPVLWLLAP